MVIIEGQHRFIACKNLGLPIYFRICNEDLYPMMQTLNRGRRNWNYSNFVKSRETNGDPKYIELTEFASLYDLPINVALLTYADRDTSSFIPNDREFNKCEKADKIAEWLCSIKDYNIKYTNSNTFIRSIKRAFDLYSDRQMSKLAKNILKVPKCADTEGYLTCFKNIIR